MKLTLSEYLDNTWSLGKKCVVRIEFILHFYSVVFLCKTSFLWFRNYVQQYVGLLCAM